MSPFLFADNFLASSILSLVMPVTLVIVLAVWYVRTSGRIPTASRRSSPAMPPPEVVAAAPDTEDVTPAGPPPGEIL